MASVLGDQALVGIDKATKSFFANNLTSSRLTFTRFWDLIFNSLMRPLGIVILNVFFDCINQLFLTEDNEMRKAFIFYTFYEALNK